MFEKLLRSGKSWSGHERNCCFLNVGHGQFATASAIAELDFPDDGRAVASVDWERDGDLDLWVVNRTAPQLRYLQNQTSRQKHFVSFRLVGTKSNRDAIGARVELILNSGKRIQTVRAGEGFLGQSSKSIHFGLGSESTIKRVVIRWPGGKEEDFTGVKINSHWKLVEGERTARLISKRQPSKPLRNNELPTLPLTSRARIWLSPRVQIPDADLGAETTLITLWSPTCPVCLKELKKLGQCQPVTSSNLKVRALCVGRLDQDWQQKLSLPFELKQASTALMEKLEVLRGTLFERQQPFPAPTSFLCSKGQLVAIYVGPVESHQLIEDLKNLNREDQLSLAVPFTGRWFKKPRDPQMHRLIHALDEQGHSQEAHRLAKLANHELAKQACDQGASLAQQGKLTQAKRLFQRAIQLDADFAIAHFNLAASYLAQNRFPEARLECQVALRCADLPQAWSLLATIEMKQGSLLTAVPYLEKSLRGDSDNVQCRYNLAVACSKMKRYADCAHHFRAVLTLSPQHLKAMRYLAWLYATCPDPEIRQPAKAIQLAEKVNQATGSRIPILLDTLAASYANAGLFEKARSTATHALKQAQLYRQKRLAGEITKRLELYKQNQSYREK